MERTAHIGMQVRERWATTLDWLYPPHCPGCRVTVAARATCCPACTRTLPWLPGPYCSICGQALGPGHGICSDCRQRDPAFRAGRSALHYAGPVQRVIVDWKYKGFTYYTPLVRRWMRAFYAELPAQRYAALDALVPIPLHPDRLRWRGFNSATELALEISASWDLPCWQGALVRARATPTQQRQPSKAERWANLSAAFWCPDPAWIAGKRLCLVDDVATTGATLHHAALTLRRAGARSVTFLTLARQQQMPPLSGAIGGATHVEEQRKSL